MRTQVPNYPHDLFTDEALADPYGHYRALRDLGPVVWLEAHDMFVLPRYEQARAVLADPVTYCSGQGVGLNQVINERFAGKSTLMTDGPQHELQRKVLAQGLTPRALRSLNEEVEALADTLVEQLVGKGSFDAVVDLARALPLKVVPDLVGWPEEGREHLLAWAAATFDLLGPLNERAKCALPLAQAMQQYAAQIAADGSMKPGSIGAGVIEAAERGVIEPERVPALIVGYLAPSLDTTISAIGSAVWLLATHPEQWEALRADPSLAPNAFNEVVRLESPLRAFTRVTTEAVEVEGVQIPVGSRTLVHFGCANRDDRHFADAERFDITRRNAGEHLGFGYGVHGCAGQGLARMEGQAVLGALARRVGSLELGSPVRDHNNLINAWASLPVTVTSA